MHNVKKKMKMKQRKEEDAMLWARGTVTLGASS